MNITTRLYSFLILKAHHTWGPGKPRWGMITAKRYVLNCKLVLPACAWFTWIQASCYETIHWIHQNLNVHTFHIKYAVFTFCSQLNAQDSGISTRIWLCTWWIQSLYQCITDVYMVPWVVCLTFSVPNDCGLRFLWSKCYVAHCHHKSF